MLYQPISGELAEIMRDGIKRKVFPGGVLATIENGRVSMGTFGRHTYNTESQEVTGDSIFDLASITKSIPLACVMLQLVEEGRINFDTKVIDILPEFGNYENKKEVTIIHLLTYTVNFVIDGMSTMKDLPAEKIRETILSAPLRTEPGKEYFYTNTTAFILGCIVKTVTGNDLATGVQTRFFDPLHMENTFFTVPESRKSDCLPTEITEERGLIQGKVHDEGTYATKKLLNSGVAGLFSTAPDLITFSQILLNNGEYIDQGFFEPETINQMEYFYLPGIDKPLSLFGQKEWQRVSKHSPVLGGLPDNVFYKSGFTGTNIVFDLQKKKALILLTNHIYPKRREDFSEFMEFQKRVVEVFFR